MSFLKVLVMLFLGGLTAFNVTATLMNWGAEDSDELTDVSIRETSSSGHGHFFAYYSTRTHTGGGISAGK